MKKKTVFVLLCVCFCLCMSGIMGIQGKAEDAFIVEEEVIIGGENSPGGKEQSIPPALPNEAAVPEKTVLDLEVESPVQPEKSTKKENVIKENEGQEMPVSVNSVPPVFQVPVRRRQSEQVKQVTDAEESEGHKVEEDSITEEPVSLQVEQEAEGKNKNPWWMLGLAGVFCFGGYISVFLQRKNRKN